MRGFLLAALLSPVAALVLVAPAGATVPVNLMPPSIDSNPPGTAYVSGGLADAGGSWTATPAPGTAIAVQWLRCDADGQLCTPIPGATTTNYRLTTADLGHTIRVQETGSNGPDVSAPVVSAPTVVVRALPVGVNYTSRPVISGRPVIGQTLRVSDGGWTGTPPITFSYQWQRCGGVLNPGGKSFTIVCVDIPGATQNTYTVTGADAGKLMLAFVTGTNSVSSYRLPASGYTLPVPEPPKTISDALEAVLDLAPGVSHTVSAAELLAAGGYRTSFRALKPGRLTIEWTTQSKHRTVRVAFARRTFRHRGTYPVKIGLTRRGRALLRGEDRLRMRLVASYQGHKIIEAVVERPDGRFRYVAP
jgi:hypothetical protein